MDCGVVGDDRRPVVGARSICSFCDRCRVSVFVVAGELDAATAGQLARRLSAPPAVRLIDRSGVTFIDASGLRVEPRTGPARTGVV